MFEMTPEHMARTLLVAKGRERERCIMVLEGMLDDPKLAYNRIHHEALAEAIKRLRGGVAEVERVATPAADGLPAEREIPDDDEGLFLARRFGRFSGGAE